MDWREYTCRASMRNGKELNQSPVNPKYAQSPRSGFRCSWTPPRNKWTEVTPVTQPASMILESRELLWTKLYWLEKEQETLLPSRNLQFQAELRNQTRLQKNRKYTLKSAKSIREVWRKCYLPHSLFIAGSWERFQEFLEATPPCTGSQRPH